MKKLLYFLFILSSTLVYGQSEVKNKIGVAELLVRSDMIREAHNILKEVEPLSNPGDSLYPYFLWYYNYTTAMMEDSFRMKEQFDSSLHYGLKALQLIETGKPYFDDQFAKREYWMVKNIVVSYIGLNQMENAKKYKDILYDAYKEKKLPESLDKYFNFSFKKMDGKNVWGYEWFEELPEDRFSKSFSKVVYYVYSTDENGKDQDQLYRLHVLMFHKLDSSVKFDYVLTKIVPTEKGETRSTLYEYTYQKEIDYQKLQTDIVEIVKGNQPNSNKQK